MRTVAIVQARLGSTRLPGKVLADLSGRTMLARVVRRLRRCERLDDVVVATSVSRADDEIAAECRLLDAPVFRGSEADVLDRYYRAALTHGAGVVVRVTADCPLIDPEIVDLVVERFRATRADYARNTETRTYPRGLDAEAVALPALVLAWHQARADYERVHVTPYLYGHPDSFRVTSVTHGIDYSGHRWTVDTPEDLALVRAIYERLGGDDACTWLEVLNLLAREPELGDINRHVRQKPLRAG
jgi:spore coat polysaccharide biosynthesis protein SpsF